MNYQTKEVLVLYTGGTIGMQKNENGVLVPVPNTFAATLKGFKELYIKNLAEQMGLKKNQLVMKAPKNITVIYEIKEYDPLLDSSNVSIGEWITIARDIRNNYCRYDGFVVIHGTDTLAYTSSVLSFMLENLSKPIIITGSQIPIFEACTDATQNLISSLIFASSYKIPEVAVFFYDKLIRGNRVKKVSALEFNAFDSPNYHVLAEIKMGRNRISEQIKFYSYCILEPKCHNMQFKVHTNLNSNIGIIYFSPTLTSTQIKKFLEPPLVGAVIQTFGSGNIPSNDKDIIKSLKQAIDRGVIIINVTQCNKGSVTSAYETTQDLNQIGVIAGNDLTVEAAYAKLVVLLGFPETAERNHQLRHSIRGEMTER